LAGQQTYVTRWYKVSWWVTTPFTLLLLALQLYEEAFLTVRDGPQMTGYTFMHTHPLAFVVGTIALFFSYLWCALITVKLLKSRGRLERPVLAMYLVLVAAIVVSSLPSELLAAVGRTLLPS